MAQTNESFKEEVLQRLENAFKDVHALHASIARADSAIAQGAPSDATRAALEQQLSESYSEIAELKLSVRADPVETTPNSSMSSSPLASDMA